MKAKGRARLLRAASTAEEKQLWDSVKNRGLGPKFRRQYPITFVYREEPHCFIADFYCAERRLIIELDGEFHSTRSDYDGYRTFLIETLGFKIIRFSNSEIRTSFSTVKKNIIKTIGISGD